jgi:Type II CAAX prenyl endopeptidase Rce1-like
MTAALAVVAVLAFYAFFYPYVVRRWGPLTQALVERLQLARDHPVREIEAVGKLAAAAVAQAMFAVGLWALTEVDVGSLFGLQLDLVALGVVLGIGEIALAGSLSAAAVQAIAVASPAEPSARAGWLARSRGGWMGYFAATVAAAPAWFSAASISLYVAVEELVFRGIMITLLADHGAAIAIGLPLVLFVCIQVFGLPSLRAALFPLIGAAVIGVAHGVIFWHVPEILPLIAAHLTFFGGALLLATPADRPAAAAGVR